MKTPTFSALPEDDELFMSHAVEEARCAQRSGEVPVGAVVVRRGQVIARGQNRVIRDSDPVAHAEIVALRAAGQVLGNYRLGDCQLYTTLEPCAMCAGAVMHARLDRLIYAAPDLKAGACGSVLEILNHPRLNHRVKVMPGVLEPLCAEMLTGFFRERRANASRGARSDK